MRKLMAVLLTLGILVVMVVTASPVLAWWEAHTTLNITDASPNPVEQGSSVTLTITETNDGAYDIYQVWIDLHAWGTLTYADAPSFLVGNNNEILEPGETWQWVVTLGPINAETNITATGHGYANNNPAWDVTPESNPNLFSSEEKTVTLYVTPPNGNGGDFEGHTPGYWRNHLEDWQCYDPGGDYFEAVFGVDIKGDDITLLEAIRIKGGKEKALIRHATAALLSACHGAINYPMNVGEVIAAVQDAFTPGGDWNINTLKSQFDEWNNLGADMSS